MAQTKLISLRLDEGLLSTIDEIAAKQNYLDRSKVISRLLSSMVQCCQHQSIYQILNCYDPFSDGITIQVTQKQ